MKIETLFERLKTHEKAVTDLRKKITSILAAKIKALPVNISAIYQGLNLSRNQYYLRVEKNGFSDTEIEQIIKVLSFYNVDLQQIAGVQKTAKKQTKNLTKNNAKNEQSATEPGTTTEDQDKSGLLADPAAQNSSSKSAEDQEDQPAAAVKQSSKTIPFAVHTDGTDSGRKAKV